MEIILLDRGDSFEGDWLSLEDCFGVTKETIDGFCTANDMEITVIRSVARSFADIHYHDIYVNDLLYYTIDQFRTID